MTMVDMTFHRQYHNVILLADLGCELLEPGFKPIYQKELSPIAWAKHKVIIYHNSDKFMLQIYELYITTSSHYNYIGR